MIYRTRLYVLDSAFTLPNHTQQRKLGVYRMHIDQEGSFRRALTAGVNLFTGAGFSVLAKDADDQPLPLGFQLRNELADRFDVPGGRDLDLPQLATVISSRERARFESFVRRRLTVAKFDDRYRVIDSLKIRTIFSVNLDDLVHNIYTGSALHYINDMDRRGSSYGDRTAVDYIALHGSVKDYTRSFVFGSQELAAAFARDRDRWYLLSSRLQDVPSLFWGYSLADAGVLQILHPGTRDMRDLKPMWITLIQSSADDGTVAYFKAMGFNLIIGTTSEVLDYLKTVEPPRVTLTTPGAPTRDVFPDYAVPDVESLPVRPLDVFFAGAAPSWTDAASHRVPRLSHYHELVNFIHLRENVIIIGIPGCGKSTMLMQAALDTDIDGHKLYSNAMSLEKAEMIIARLGGQQCTVFVENFTDSVQAFDRLAAEPNIQVIGTDRDYNFEIILHMLDAKRYTVMQVSEISPADIQAIYDAIPTHQRLPRYVKPVTDPGRGPSLFELIQANLIGPGLVTRYTDALEQLEAKNPLLVDLLLVTCYMQQARTFASMDLLLAFFRDVISIADYSELYELISTLGRMISNTESNWTPDDLQDYFAPRSPLLAETILGRAAKPKVIRRMLTKFWAEVSPYRIPNFSTFYRNAFDWRLVRRAFPIADEGKAFYEYLLDKGSSPYLRQHGALYLADHKRYREAFEWIDEALDEPSLRGKAGAWTIRNSHAIILFRANIEAPETPDGVVEATLDRSMAILNDCYHRDRRKAYHATTFAQQAIRYHQRFNNDQSAEYLKTAREWLLEERRTAPWNRMVQELLREMMAVR